MISLNFDLVKYWLFLILEVIKFKTVFLLQDLKGSSDTCFRGRRYSCHRSLSLQYFCPCHRSSTLSSSQFLFSLVLFPQTLCNQQSVEFYFSHHSSFHSSLLLKVSYVSVQHTNITLKYFGVWHFNTVLALCHRGLYLIFSNSLTIQISEA